MRTFILDAVRAQAAAAQIDANETITFARELEYIETQTYDIEYPDCKGRQLIPMGTGLGPVDEYLTWRQFDKRGAAIEGNMNSDVIPQVTVEGQEFHARVVDILIGYGYSVLEIRQSIKLGRPLDVMKAAAARDLVERKVDNMLATGSSQSASNSIFGLYNQPNATAVAVGGTAYWNAAPSSGTQQTPKGAVGALNAAYAAMVKATKYLHKPDTLILDTASKAWIETTPCSNADTNFAGSVQTVEQYIRQNCGWLKKIDTWQQGDTAGPSSKARAVLFQSTPDVAAYYVPQEFEQLPPQLFNWRFNIPCHARCAGVISRRPAALYYLDGLQP